MKNLGGALLAVCFLSGCAEADYEKGVAAQAAGDYAEALNQWMVTSDDPRCMRAIGVMYDYGEGLPRDEFKAAEWYTRAAEKGEYRAIAQLANFSLTNAGGVPHNPTEWRRKLEGIQGKDGYADYVLASFYMKGYGGEKDLDKAHSLLRGLVNKGYTQLETTLRRLEQRLDDRKAGVLEADVLAAEMTRDNASFDRNYKDRRIVISGWVSSAARLNDYGYVVKFGGQSPSILPRDNILAVFYEPSRTGVLATLTPGTFVKLNGIYVGKHPFPLEECAFTLFGCSLNEVVSDDTRP
ncbi:MAG: hypothetical protein LBO68_01630 [Synergistaceae bacterium]|jgi:hypothetical protein|nr:hypothetical protein [Synergistaceae bacterium]